MTVFTAYLWTVGQTVEKKSPFSNEKRNTCARGLFHTFPVFKCYQDSVHMTSHADYSESESTYSIHYFRFQEHVERFLLLTFVLRHPGWGTLLQEAIGDVPLDWVGFSRLE